MNFDFVDDEALSIYCLRIVSEMILLFGISECEAFVRVASFIEPFKAELSSQILHRSVPYWAEGIYFRWDEDGEMTGEPKPIPSSSGANL